MGDLGKRILVAYVASECERQLFWELGKGDPAWLDPLDKPRSITRPPGYTELLTRLGHDYEQKVYKPLLAFPVTECNVAGKGEVSRKLLKPAGFAALHGRTIARGISILLEHEIENPPAALDFLFPPKPGGSRPGIPSGPAPDVEDFRPDVVIVQKIDPASHVRELLPGGAIRVVPPAELASRLAITVIDIKNVHEDKIGKKQFIEIFYYAFIMAFYLEQHGLDDRYFVALDGNGIFPQREDAEISGIASMDDFLALCIPISWDGSQRICLSTVAMVQGLWQRAPCSVDSIPPKISPGCAYCYYVEDCKHRLGMNGTNPPRTWSLDLIPSTPASIREQLKGLGMATIGDVVAGIGTACTGMNPDPITAERPLLQLKCDALVSGSMQLPAPGVVYSYAIPPFTPLAAIITCESDPSNDHVYIACLQLDASVAPKAPYAGLFDDWWIEWDDAIRMNVPAATIKQRLDTILPVPITIEEIESFTAALRMLGGTTCITLPSTTPGAANPRARFHAMRMIVSRSLDHAEETRLATQFILTMHAILVVANTMEAHLKAGTSAAYPGWCIGPDLGIFYWGEDQLDNIELLLERHVAHLIADPVAWPAMLDLIEWITPSASEVSHPYQHKKIFDLKGFAQTVLGLPCVINYTWPDVARAIDPGFLISTKYWVPHYDYFDYRFWHQFLDETDASKKAAMAAEIGRQVSHKMRTLNTIRYKLQSRARSALSSHAKPVTLETYRSVPLDSTFHPIAHAWYMYSRLSGAMQEMDADDVRTTFPDRAIGKLDAASITVPVRHANSTTSGYHYTFSIPEPSSNVTAREGDMMLAIPEEKRDLRMDRVARQWCIVIKDMAWNHARCCFDVVTEDTSSDLHALYHDEFDRPPASTRWYLYPWSSDTWSPKLYSPRKKGTLDGLLQRRAFGTSWLGSWLAWSWRVRTNPVLRWPSSWTFSAPEVYLFAPGALATGTPPPSLTRFDSRLDKKPDASQIEAINRALHAIIFGIQGPPGTGKSQTITALMNELHVRRRKRGQRGTRILVTAFSYAALKVIVEKVLASVDPAGRPAPIARFQLVYIRSDSQDPYPDARVCDLSRSYKTWKWNGCTNTVTQANGLDRYLEQDAIIFANAHALYYLVDRVPEEFSFDLIVIDEASQLPVDYAMASLQYVARHDITLQPRGVAPGKMVAGMPVADGDAIDGLEVDGGIEASRFTKVVIVGDYNQLPPVQPVKPPERLDSVLGSFFSYYVLQHRIENMQLVYNYRSHDDIVAFTRFTNIYGSLKASPVPGKAQQTLQGNIAAVQEPWIKDVLDPQRVVSAIIHDRRHETSVSLLESELAASIVLAYHAMVAPATAAEEERFWEEKVGIVSPHNAQGRIIIRRLYDALAGASPRKTLLAPSDLMARLKATVYSVEKFQGSDRELIVASYGISDRDQIAAEEEFIYDLNRFNVLTSRAKHKIILICSKTLLSHIPGDRVVMSHAEKLHAYVYRYCNDAMTLLPKNELGGIEPVEFRWHGHGTRIQDTFAIRVARASGKVTVRFPPHPRYVPVFAALPGKIRKKRLPSGNDVESWEFDERDLHAIKAHVPVPLGWLRGTPARATTSTPVTARPMPGPGKPGAP